jgi:TolB protein
MEADHVQLRPARIPAMTPALTFADPEKGSIMPLFTPLRALFIATLVCLALPLSAHAELKVDITRGNYQPMPVAVMDFQGSTLEERQMGQQVAGIVRANLERSGLFTLIPQEAFIERTLDVSVQPRFSDWQLIKADALVTGRVYLQQDGLLLVEFRLWDVFGRQQIHGMQLGLAADSWRRLGHMVSDDVYTKLTGESGYFDTRVVFVHETGPKTNRRKQLAIMDQDGADPSFLTGGNSIVLTPRFSPTDQEITYISYEGGRPRVYLFNIQTGRQEVLGTFPNMTFAPRFSPDGRAVIFSMVEGSNSDVYVMDLNRRSQPRRLTDNPAIDTSPSFAPDGRRVVFNSDRGGSPQLYIMNVDGSPITCPTGGQADACRISYGEGRYSTPVWSPRGDLIAFTKQSKGRFGIGVIRPDGSGERMLTDAYLDEAPTWSPNGRVLMFFREMRPGSGPTLWSVDLTGRNLRRVPTPNDASDPAWSPLHPR